MVCWLVAERPSNILVYLRDGQKDLAEVNARGLN